MQSSQQEQRRLRRRPESSEEARRADAQRHLDARLQRLQDYAASLEAALAAGPPPAQGPHLERQLAQALREIRAAAQPRIPRPKGTAVRSGGDTTAGTNDSAPTAPPAGA